MVRHPPSFRAASSVPPSCPRGPDLNLLRQLDSPLLVFPGRTYRLDAYSRLGSPPASLALPHLSPAGASLPLPPYGTLRLDPTQLTALPILALPQPAGAASTSVAFPSQPSLVGATVHAQALLVAFPFGLSRLTNATADMVLR